MTDPSLSIEERAHLAFAWLSRNSDPAQVWPGEFDREPEVPRVVCDCGRHVPYKDFYTIADGPYRERHCCLDCWLQSRVAS